MFSSFPCYMGVFGVSIGNRRRPVLSASHACCSFTFKTFQWGSLPAKQDVRLRRDFKSSAVAVVHVRHVFNMASIAGVCPVSDGADRCQPSGFLVLLRVKDYGR